MPYTGAVVVDAEAEPHLTGNTFAHNAGGTMAEARTYHRGDVITSAIDCHQSGYARIDAPVGEPFQIEFHIEMA